MRKRIAVRIMEMDAGRRLGMAAVLMVVLWCAVWWAL
jgi:hypothetical protein